MYSFAIPGLIGTEGSAASLVDQNYILAIKAYQERLPIRCTGDLVKEANHFILINPHKIEISNI